MELLFMQVGFILNVTNNWNLKKENMLKKNYYLKNSMALRLKLWNFILVIS